MSGRARIAMVLGGLASSCSIDSRTPGIASATVQNPALPGGPNAAGSAGSNGASRTGAEGSSTDPGTSAPRVAEEPRAQTVAPSMAPAGAGDAFAGAGGAAENGTMPVPATGQPVLHLTLGGDGAGRVDVSIPGAGVQSCTATCDVSVPAGAHLMLQAAALPYSEFLGWSGVACATGTACSDVEPGADVRANFQLAYNAAFVSQRTYTIPELPRPGAAANQECATLAAAAGLHGSRWVAWLGAEGPTTDLSDDITPVQFLQNPGGWVRTDGVPLARSRAGLLAGEMLNPLNRTETRAPSVGGSWSGADVDGRVYRALGTVANDCNNWSSTGAEIGGIALSTSVGSYWTGSSGAGCGASAALQCFGDDAAPEVPLPPRDPAKRIAFVSRTLFSPGPGIQGADEICQREACAAGLTGSSNCALDLGTQRQFSSYLHTSQQPAWERFDLTGPGWVRVDGIDWLPVAGDLAGDAANQVTGFNVFADGTYNSGVDRVVWVGTPSGASCCADWTSSTANGRASSTTDVGFALSQDIISDWTCDNPEKVLCLQQ